MEKDLQVLVKRNLERPSLYTNRKVRAFVARYVAIRSAPFQDQNQGTPEVNIQELLKDLTRAAEAVARRVGSELPELGESADQAQILKVQAHLKKTGSKGLEEQEYKQVSSFALKYMLRENEGQSVAYFKEVVEPEFNLL